MHACVKGVWLFSNDSVIFSGCVVPIHDRILTLWQNENQQTENCPKAGQEKERKKRENAVQLLIFKRSYHRVTK